MCRFENIRYELCGDEVEKKVAPCENFRRGFQDKYCRNTAANTFIENKHEVCPKCVDERRQPATTTVPDRGDYSKIRIVERVDFVSKYEEPYSYYYDDAVLTSQGIEHRRPDDAWMRNLADLDNESLPPYPKKEPEEQPEASGSKLKKKASREGSPDPLSQSWVTHAGSPEDSPWEVIDSDYDSSATPAREPSQIKEGKAEKPKTSMKGQSSKRG